MTIWTRSVGDGLNVNIEQDGGRLYFRVWKYHEWGSFTLYYFPVKFIESLGPALRRIAVTFMHGLMEANGIGILLGDDDAEFILDQLSEKDEDPQGWKGRKRILELLPDGKGRQAAKTRGNDLLLQGPAESDRGIRSTERVRKDTGRCHAQGTSIPDTGTRHHGVRIRRLLFRKPGFPSEYHLNIR